ncbi:3246_t:CDS:2, partial [Racocetra fulgida]
KQKEVDEEGAESDKRKQKKVGKEGAKKEIGKERAESNKEKQKEVSEEKAEKKVDKEKAESDKEKQKEVDEEEAEINKKIQKEVDKGKQKEIVSIYQLILRKIIFTVSSCQKSNISASDVNNQDPNTDDIKIIKTLTNTENLSTTFIRIRKTRSSEGGK